MDYLSVTLSLAHQVTPPHMEQVSLHHGRVSAPLSGHQLRVHDALLLIERAAGLCAF